VRLFRKRHAVGAKPGTLVMSSSAPAPRIRVMEWKGDDLEDYSVEDPASISADSESMRWIDVQGLGDEATITTLGQTFGIHMLALEDVVNVPQRPKADAYEDHQLVVTRMARITGDAEVSEQVSVIVLPRLVITFQEQYGDVLEPVRTRLKDGKSRIRQSGSDYLAYAIIDTIVDGYFPVLESLGDRLSDLEEEALANPRPSLLRELSEHRIRLLAMRRAVWPMRESLRMMSLETTGMFGDDVRLFLRDTYDHCLQLTEVIESYREIIGGTMNTYLSAVGNRTNEIMRVLTLMASIFIPLTFVAGVYGMNFENMPELKWPFGYPLALSVMTVLAVSMWLWFRRSGWVGSNRDRSSEP
jgi:magnesium transporter